VVGWCAQVFADCADKVAHYKDQLEQRMDEKRFQAAVQVRRDAGP
jgi:hypothetical protein